MTDAPSLGNDDISNSTRRALLEYNTLYSTKMVQGNKT